MFRRRKGPALSGIPSFADDAECKSEKYRNSSRVSATLLCRVGALIVLLVLPVVQFFLLDKYAWVYRRCFKARLLNHSTLAAIPCVEARTHELAEQDVTLSNNGTEIQFSETAVPHVHYTITAPLLDQTRTLAWCSMEAIYRMCQVEDCVVHIWIVDQAATALHNGASWFQEMQSTLQDSRHCIHIISNGSVDERFEGSSCSIPPSCPVSLARATEMREWLASPPASQQLPAHISDAWRLVSLAEYGGLYLDADVLPLSPNILYLPSPTVPTQRRVGAYRLNGGVLVSSCDSDSFLHSLIDDHLSWAPRLAELPRSQQTFGFLGPCALTRVYERLANKKEVTILSDDRVEGPLSVESFCRDDERIAFHFSGKRKSRWYDDITMGHSCIEYASPCGRCLSSYHEF